VNLAKLRFAVVTIAVLVTVSFAHEILSRLPAYVRLHNEEPFYVAESIDKVAGACVCLLAVGMMFRTGVRGVLRVLGLCASIPRALIFALIASSPMLLGFALTRSLTQHIQLRPLLFLTVLSPIVEEIEFRGFGVLQLKNRTGWPFLESAGLFFLLAAGGVTFAWLAQRWQNLWVPVALHVSMNLWWELFAVARSVIGGWFPFILQNTTVLLAILLTLYCTRAKMQVAISTS
jgi:uncharacterized protein